MIGAAAPSTRLCDYTAENLVRTAILRNERESLPEFARPIRPALIQ